MTVGPLLAQDGIVDADVRSFFDSVDHEWLLRIVSHRIADRRILRLIRRWLRAGVMEGGEWKGTDTGTPQGAGISPLLANIFLHYIFVSDAGTPCFRRRVRRPGSSSRVRREEERWKRGRSGTGSG